MRLASVALLVFGLAGCHWLLPFGGATDTRAADRPTDLARPPDRGPLSDACVACRAVTHASCDDVAKTCGCARSGVYALSVGSSSFEGWCELELRPGEGWLLVGRSVRAEISCGGFGGGFGWSSGCGEVHEDNGPYSLGVLAKKLPVAQILVGSRLAGKEWGQNVYKFKVPQPFETACKGACALGQAEVVKGSCTPEGWPFMLTHAGFVETRTYFFFRDMPELMNFGLFPGGFNLASGIQPATPCQRWGELQNTQGMIFVR